VRILFTGARAPATLELARLAAQAGHEAHAADSTGLHLCRWSRFVQASHRLAAPRHDRTAFARDLRRAVREHDVDLIVPTCEEVFYLARLRHELDAPVLVGPLEQLAAWHDKGRFVGEAYAAGVAAPETYRIESADALAEHLRAAEGEWILKPVYSRFATRVHPVEGGAAAPADVCPTPRDPWVLQRRLRGPSLCTYSIAHDGVLAAHATYRPEATAGPLGAAISFVGEDHPGTEAWVRRFARFHRITGQVSFDFIETDGGVVAIECNPRLTSGAHLFRDDPRLADALTGAGGSADDTRRADDTRCNAGSCCTDDSRCTGSALLAQSPSWTEPALKAASACWSGAPPPTREPSSAAPVLEASSSVLRPRPGRRFQSRLALRHYGYSLPYGEDLVRHPEDPWPYRMQGIVWARLWAGALRTRMDVRAYSTRDIEWNGEALP
jgi:hypothetical protein